MASTLSIAEIEAPEPVGRIVLVSDGRRLVALDFGSREGRIRRFLIPRFGPDAPLAEADDPQGFASAIRAYLGGEVTALNDIPAHGGGTPFQERVWTALRGIRPGETRSYGQIAAALGRPGASRAVGLANGSNPINLVVPCHRVIGAAGALTGYGGGLDRKRWLLAHERRAAPPEGLLAFA